MLAPHLAQDAIAIGLSDLDQLANGGQCRLEITGLLRNNDNAVIGLVIGERNAEAIVNAAAGRHQESQVDPVLVRQNRVAVFLQDLQLVHAADDRRPEQRLTAGE